MVDFWSRNGDFSRENADPWKERYQKRRLENVALLKSQVSGLRFTQFTLTISYIHINIF